MSKRRPPPSLLLLLAMLSFTLFTIRSVPAVAEVRRLHERIIDPSRENALLVEQPAEGQNPAALRLPQDRGEITEPRHGSTARAGEEPFELGRPPDSAESHQRLRQWRPDLQTARTSDQLSYHSSFNPSIAPHKRISSLDQVGEDYTLRLASTELTEVTVGGTAQPDHDLFWGSLMVRFVPNQPIPIPSVSPAARILSYRVRPEQPLRFYRDGAGNFYVVSDQAGEGRLVFVTDAPSTYFGGPLPPNVRATDVPAAYRPTLPTGVARAAAQVATRLGLDRSAPIARNLTRLVAYLRSFENEPLEGRMSGDRYLTLAFGRRGVCRHRAFVFVVTAQALGIPARFITNEVHAFSEVFIPTVGWVRIDLGGEARLSPEAEPVAHHEPQAPDPFPWPPGSREPGQQEGRGGRSGGGGGQLARPGGEPRPRPGGDSTADTAGPQEEGSATNDVVDDAALEGESEAEETLDDPAETQRRRLAVFLDRSAATVVRGESLALTGAVRDANGPVAGARVSLWLRGSARAGPIRLGRAACDDTGRFRARFAVPETVPTGTYGVIARAEPPANED